MPGPWYVTIEGQQVTATQLAAGLKAGTIVENSGGARYSWATPAAPVPAPSSGPTPLVNPWAGYVAPPSAGPLNDLTDFRGALPIAGNFDYAFYAPTAGLTPGERQDVLEQQHNLFVQEGSLDGGGFSGFALGVAFPLSGPPRRRTRRGGLWI